MHDLESNSESVNHLINKLCYSILEEYELSSQVQKEDIVRKLKSLSFQILLKKCPVYNGNELEDVEPQRELAIQIFSAKLNSRSNAANFEIFEDQLGAIETEPYFWDGHPGKAVLQFLLALQQNADNVQEMVNHWILINKHFVAYSFPPFSSLIIT